MAQPSKGPRERLGRVPIAVYTELEGRALDAGVSSVSQYVSDLLCRYTGHEDLVQELDPGKQLIRRPMDEDSDMPDTRSANELSD